jgi:hypothetical protein
VRAEVHAGKRDGRDENQCSPGDEDSGERARGLPVQHQSRGSEEDRPHGGVAAREAVARFRREGRPEIRPAAPEAPLQQRAPCRAQKHRPTEKPRRGSAVEEDERARQKDRRRDQEPLASEKRDRVNDTVSSGRVQISHRGGDAAVESRKEVQVVTPRRRDPGGGRTNR